MKTFFFDISCHVNAPSEPIFAMLMDHEGYRFFPGFTSSKLIQAGTDHRDGVGAIRAGWFNGTYVVEEVMECEPPSKIVYKTVKCTIPLDHDGGLIELTPSAIGGTDVRWRTSFRVAVPLIGDLLGYLCAPGLDKTIHNILNHVKREVERTQETLQLAYSKI